MRKHESLERSLPVSFADKRLLRLALIHSSYLNEGAGEFSHSNERLEFLGDAVLGVVVADELYRRYPEWTEGQLTQVRAGLVQGETLATAADRLGLGSHLYMGKGEEAGGGRVRPTNLAAALEALVGALFLDQGFQPARDLVLHVLSQELSALGPESAPRSPKSALQEIVQQRGLAAPSYRIVSATGADHARIFTAEVVVAGKVAGKGEGKRKSLAEQQAAAEALIALDGSQ